MARAALVPKGKPIKKRELTPVTSYDQVPEGMTEKEAREFWDTHAFTEEYLASAPRVPEDALPPAGQVQRYGPILLDREVFRKARWFARRRGVEVEDLIDPLVTRALAAEAEHTRGVGSRRGSVAGGER